MSLTDEFFIQRGQKLNTLIEQGYSNIDELAKTAGITDGQLIQAQYLPHTTYNQPPICIT